MTLLPPLGLDVAKARFNASLVRESGKLRHSSFANTPAGFAQLAAWLGKPGAGTAHARLEATGTYYEALAAYLHAGGTPSASSTRPRSKPPRRAGSHARRTTGWTPS